MDIHKPYMSEGAKPKFQRGTTDAGCLLIHGFSAAPAEVSWLGGYLHETLGMTTYAPRLAGHGTAPRDMRHLRWQDWYASVCDGYELLASQCEKVFVAGLSMGGLLSLLLLASDHAQLEAGALLATPVLYSHNRVAMTRYLKYLMDMKDMPDNTTLPGMLREEQERRGEPIIGRTHYNRWSIRAVSQLYELTLEVREQIPHINTPMTLISARNDHSVALASIDYIHGNAQTPHIESHILEKSGHIITQDIERDTAFEITAQFFSQFLVAEKAE